MRKFFTLVFLLISGLSMSQVIEIPSGNPSGTGAGTATFRKPLGTTRSFERSSMIYRQSDIGVLGTITSVAFFVDSLNQPGDAITRIFIKETADTSFALPGTVAAEETGALLVFDDTIPASAFTDSSWIVVNLTTPFVHQNPLNIKVIVETNSGGLNGTDINLVSKGFRYFNTTSNLLQYWQSPANNGTPPAGNGTLSPLRPNIQFDITPLASCSVPPNAGVAAVNDDTVCTGQALSFNLSGQDIGLGLTYQWISSVDGISFNNMPGDTLTSMNTLAGNDLFFACVVTCSGVSDTTNVISLTLNPFYLCYCQANIGGDCTNAIDSIAIQGTTLQNGPTGCNGAYTQWPLSGNTTTQLTQGEPYTITGRFTTNARVSVWIDYDQSGTFDTDEWTQLATTTTPGIDYSAVVFVDPNALTGLTGMRVRSRATAGQNDSTTACATFGTGETEDYVIEILASANCVSPPDAGTVNASQDSVCAGELVNFSLVGNTTGAGLTYQWMTSTDGLNWAADSGATSPFYNLVVDSLVYVTCITTCSGVSDTAIAASVSILPFYLCYCSDALGGNCATSAIDSVAVELTTLANGLSGCSTGNYIAYPATGNTTATLYQGITHNLVTRYSGTVRAGVWIDYDHSGTFDNNEYTNITNNTAGNIDVVTAISLPQNALTGLTGMRIRTRATNGQLDATVPCATFGSGETEDYLITIDPAPPCTAPPDAGVLSASNDSVCAGDSVSFSLTVTTIGAGLTLQWISSADGLTWNDIVGANGNSYGQVITSAGYFACVALCQNSPDTSNAVYISLNSFLDCYCTAGLGGNCAASAIDSLAFAGTGFVNANSGCAPGNYTLYPDTGSLTLTLDGGQTYDLRAVFNGDVRAVIWIDFDQNGVYDAYEGTQICTTSVAGAEVSASVFVPWGAVNGLTGMRIRSRVTAGVNDSTTACDAFGTGETEDYRVFINSGPVGLLSSANSELNLYPNPASNFIQLSGAAAGSIWQIADLTGKQMKLDRISTEGVQVIDIRELASGMYFLMVNHPAAGGVQTFRFIKP